LVERSVVPWPEVSFVKNPVPCKLISERDSWATALAPRRRAKLAIIKIIFRISISLTKYLRGVLRTAVVVLPLSMLVVRKAVEVPKSDGSAEWPDPIDKTNLHQGEEKTQQRSIVD